ncbi:sulfotransferase family protein [Ideonella sp. YS5]|uniref:sulfotransferase family protein n=1 Tax=Ideonella sp. YS5 TaxID=3453714 RepID=UPI003EF052AD
MSRPDDLAALRSWAAEARPVFICGHERSGTSALQLALARHPALAPVPDVYETFIFSRTREWLADPPHAMQQAYVGGREALARLREWAARLAGGAAHTLEEDDLLRAFLAFAAHETYAGRRLLEKTPTHVLSLPRLFRLFPRAQVLACVRDPVAIADSYRLRLSRERALGKPREAWSWLELGIDELIVRLRRVDRALRDSVAFAPGRVFLVPYDWLTAVPADALAAICTFIGEPYDEAMLAPRALRRSRVDERLSQPISAAPAAPSLLAEAERTTLRRETHGLAARWRVPGCLPVGSSSAVLPERP